MAIFVTGPATLDGARTRIDYLSTLDEDDHVPNIALDDAQLTPSRELGRAGASLGFRPAAGANSAALSFWEPASSLLVGPDDAYAVNADLKRVCLQ